MKEHAVNTMPEGSRRPSTTIAMAVLVALTGLTPALAKQRVEQLAEDSAQTKRINASALLAAPVTQVCEAGAKWIRLGFNELTLGSYDTLTITSNGGDSYTFEGNHWNNRSFSARALRGSCVSIQP